MAKRIIQTDLAGEDIVIEICKFYANNSCAKCNNVSVVMLLR